MSSFFYTTTNSNIYKFKVKDFFLDFLILLELYKLEKLSFERVREELTEDWRRNVRIDKICF